MGDILFLAHRIPFPPDRGDKIRSHHLLRALAETASVHVGCFADTANDWQHEPALATIAATHCLCKRSKPVSLAGVQALALGKPVSLTAFENRCLQDWIRNTIRTQQIDTIFVFSGQMGQYVPDDFEGRVVIDLCDVDSAKFETYADASAWPRNWIERREGVLLSREEARLAHRADRTLFVSEAEAALFRSRAVGVDKSKVEAVRNGIDTEFFNPLSIEPQAELVAKPGPHFVFTGQMDYQPNVDAVERVADRLLPRIRNHFPTAEFHIVGRAPVARLMARDRQGGIRVWGEVADVRPFLAAADIVLAPLTIARGVQNKVLEAMAMVRPVLLSAEAATGIDAGDGIEFAVETTDERLIARAMELLRDPAAAQIMADNARRYVVEYQNWSAMLAPLKAIVSGSGKTLRDAA